MDKRGTEVARMYSFQDLVSITSCFSKVLWLSEGAFGSVFRGVLGGGKEIAVKRLNQDARVSERQFMSEVATLERTQHKNITRLEGYCYCLPAARGSDTAITQACQDDDVVTDRLLCYELPKGCDRRLDTVLFGTSNSNKQGLDWGTRFEVIQGICQGVQYLHNECPDAPVVGLDLNPAIIWLDDGMVPKLGDFGHSQAFLEKATPRTPTSMNAFGPITGRVAPEYVNSGMITAESDIFSLGVLMVEIVTGEKCGGNRTYHYSGRSFVENVQETWKEDYPSILSKHPALEERFIPKIRSFIKLGLRCVEERPEKRPTIDQIIRFLQYWFTNTEDVTASVLLETTEPEPAARRYVSRRRLDYLPEAGRTTTEPAERRRTTTKRSRVGDDSDSEPRPTRSRPKRKRTSDLDTEPEPEPAERRRRTKRRRSHDDDSEPEPSQRRVNGHRILGNAAFSDGSSSPEPAGRGRTKRRRSELGSQQEPEHVPPAKWNRIAEKYSGDDRGTTGTRVAGIYSGDDDDGRSP